MLSRAPRYGALLALRQAARSPASTASRRASSAA